MLAALQQYDAWALIRTGDSDTVLAVGGSPGAFSGSGGPHNGRHLAFGDRKIDPIQRRYLSLSVKCLGNTPQEDHVTSMMTPGINATLQS